jgi:hypothetical protein
MLDSLQKNKESPPRAAEYFKEVQLFALAAVWLGCRLRVELAIVAILALCFDVVADGLFTFLLSD